MEKLANPTATNIDPVCGMAVSPGKTGLVAIYQGHSYWFCARSCREAFEMNPQKYLKSRTPRRKGWLGRYLERLAKANREQFGSGGAKCH